MADHIELIARIGAAIPTADATTAAVLHDALAALVEAHGLMSQAKSRRARDRDRKRTGRSTDSADSTDHAGSSPRGATMDSTESTEARGIDGPLPPSPSLSSPTPLINPSSPPIPASSTAAPAAGTPEAEAEARLLVRFTDPTDRAGIERFLGYAADVVKRVAWAGRLGALLDKPPHFTPPELAEGLEALLTQDVGTWGPALLKIWVGRVRTEAGREALAAAEARTGVSGRSAAPGADAAAAWDYVSGELLRKQVQRTITMDDLGALGPRSRAALRAVGGMPGLAQKSERDMPFVRRDFLAAFARATASPIDGVAA